MDEISEVEIINILNRYSDKKTERERERESEREREREREKITSVFI